MAAAEATAHGHAALLLDGSFEDEEDPVGSAADQAASATLALIQGRSALTAPDHPVAYGPVPSSPCRGRASPGTTLLARGSDPTRWPARFHRQPVPGRNRPWRRGAASTGTELAWRSGTPS